MRRILNNIVSVIVKFGEIVKLKKEIVQGYVTFEKGTELAVAHYSHKYWVKLNTFGEQMNVSDLITVPFHKINETLEVVGELKRVE
jgi:hypothetical protein|tara:strand:+ start:691 stop:948 length:258 start_codon:yes stop_codon:yes gene_type:complete